MTWTDCELCDGGYTAPGQLHEEDPLMFDEDEVERCHQCYGAGGWWNCLATFEWCQQNPMAGRELRGANTPEFF